MTLRYYSGWAGIISGLGLAVEFACFTISGWTPEVAATRESAAAAFGQAGHWLRIAGVFGVFNLAFLAVFLAGLSEHVGTASRGLAAAILYPGLVGIAIHALVPIGFYLGAPVLLADGEAAASGWLPFRVMLDTAQAAGVLFMGLAMLMTGIAAFATRTVSAGFGIVGILAGIASLVMAFGTASPIAPMAAMAGIVLSLVFRIWGGIALLPDRKAG